MFTTVIFFAVQVEISFYLLRRLLGVKTQEGGKQAKVQKLQRQEILMVNIGSTASGGKVLAVKQVRGWQFLEVDFDRSLLDASSGCLLFPEVFR